MKNELNSIHALAEEFDKFFVAGAVGGEDHGTAFIVFPGTSDFEVFIGEGRINTVGPFDDHGAGFKHGIQVKVFRFRCAAETVGIQVVKIAPIRSAVDVDEDKGGAGYLIGRSPPGGNALGKGGFARPQVAIQADEITGLKEFTQTHARTARLSGTSAEEFDGVRAEDG